MNILAIDPGKACGITTFINEEHKSWVLPWQETMETAFDYISNKKIEMIICESYIITAGTLRKGRGNENWSMEGIGFLRGVCGMFDVPFVLQSPSEAKSFSTDQKLKNLGFWNPEKGGHACDSSRHLLVWLVRNGRTDLAKRSIS